MAVGMLYRPFHLATLEPENVEWWLLAARAVREVENLAAAEFVLRRALSRHPECAMLLYRLACILAQLGDHKQASEIFVKAANIDPSLWALGSKEEDLKVL